MVATTSIGDRGARALARRWRLAEQRDGELFRFELLRRRAEHHAAAPQHGHVVGDRQRLAQLVRDEHDGVAGVGEAAQPTQKLSRFFGREHGGWLVENEHPRVARRAP